MTTPTNQGQQWTPEPWTLKKEKVHSKQPVFDYVLRAADGTHVAEANQYHKDKEANAARILACVNACSGMADPQAEIATLRRMVCADDPVGLIASLQKQVEQLREAIRCALRQDPSHWQDLCRAALEQTKP